MHGQRGTCSAERTPAEAECERRVSFNTDLQDAVDSLLKKVSLDIMARIVEDQQRRSTELCKALEEERKTAM